jgi:hypothetical protein
VVCMQKLATKMETIFNVSKQRTIRLKGEEKPSKKQSTEFKSVSIATT